MINACLVIHTEGREVGNEKENTQYKYKTICFMMNKKERGLEKESGRVKTKGMSGRQRNEYYMFSI